VLRLVPGQMQLQQIQTSSGPTLIAVPSAQMTARATPPPPQQITTSPATLTLAKKSKKKKRKEEEPRLDLANLIKISGMSRILSLCLLHVVFFLIYISSCSVFCYNPF
jgi:hypothetical protein